MTDMAMVTQRERDIWRAAITLANNICVKRSDDYNADDAPLDLVNEAADCAKAVRAWVDPTDDQLVEMFAEAGVMAVAAGDRLAIHRG